MPDDLFDEFLEYDFTMGADVAKCPHCGADAPRSLFFDDKAKCPRCGEKNSVKMQRIRLWQEYTRLK
jgi:predicted RNA-binding Zn-ribbon protein involved in translation (DUF1610 family)